MDVFLFCGEKPSLPFFILTQAQDVSISALNNSQ